MAPENVKNRGEPLAEICLLGAVLPPAPSWAPVSCDLQFGQNPSPPPTYWLSIGGLKHALSTPNPQLV